MNLLKEVKLIPEKIMKQQRVLLIALTATLLVFFGSLAPAMGSENIQQTVQVWENSANLLEVSEKIALDDLATLGTSCSWLLDRPPYKYYSCRTYRIKKGIYRTYRSDSKQK